MPYKRIWEESHQEVQNEGKRGVRVLERLCERNEETGRDEMLALLGVSNGREIHSRLSKLFAELASEGGIRSREAIKRRGEGKRSTWSRGPRCAQALHIARLINKAWTDRRTPGRGRVITDVAPDAPGAKLVLRGTFCDGEIIAFTGGRQALAEALEDETLVYEGHWRDPEEIWIERIEPRPRDPAPKIPFGYDENGVWIRGSLDHVAAEVPHEMLDHADRKLYAYVRRSEAFERTVTLDDAARQMDEIRTRWMGRSDVSAWWRRINSAKPQSDVRWISTGPYSDRKWAPPVEMRARCWRDVTIRGANGTTATINVEGMRGDDARTAARAIARWRDEDPSRCGADVEVRSIRIAREQPRPVDPPDTEMDES